MILTLEISRPFQTRPFFTRGYGGVYVGWAWFALWFTPGNLQTRIARIMADHIVAEAREHGSITYFDQNQCDPLPQPDRESTGDV